MAVSVKIELDKRSQKKDGTFPLKLLAVINRKPIRIPLEYSIPENDWNQSKQAIKSSSKIVKNITRVNAQLENEKAEALDIISRLIDTGQLDKMSPIEIKTCITGQKKVETQLIEFFNLVVTELEIDRAVGNARVYKMVRDSFSNFLSKEDISLTAVTQKWLNEYVMWYKGRQRSKDDKKNDKDEKNDNAHCNGLSVNLRTLRALLNKAIKRDLLPIEAYPFKSYSIKKAPTKKRAIKQNGMDALINYVTLTPSQEKARDIFLASFYLFGAPFVDISFLKVKNIVNGRIEYNRKKGGRFYSIKITLPLQKLLDKYLLGKKAEDFIFNIIREDVQQDFYSDVCLNKGFIEYRIEGKDTLEKIKVNKYLEPFINKKEIGKERQDFLLKIVINEEVKKQYAIIRLELKTCNKHLMKMGKDCGIEHKITSYCARHSFATLAKFKGVPVPVISQSLGHADLKTTEVYLAEFDNDVMDQYNELVIGSNSML